MTKPLLIPPGTDPRTAVIRFARRHLLPSGGSLRVFVKKQAPAGSVWCDSEAIVPQSLHLEEGSRVRHATARRGELAE